MPAAVEVVAAGVRLVYPTSYVLVTDYDSNSTDSCGLTEQSGGFYNTKRSMNTCESLDDVALMGSDIYHAEPSPYTTSNHPLLGKVLYYFFVRQTLRIKFFCLSMAYITID